MCCFFSRFLLPVRLFSAAPAPKQQWRLFLGGSGQYAGCGFHSVHVCYLRRSKPKANQRVKKDETEKYDKHCSAR